MPLYLVSCVSQKLSVPAQAKDLYTSPWFGKARSYVERKGQPWFVLSAKYGLVHPDQHIAPYELTLNTMEVRDRRQWTADVLSQLEPHLDGSGGISFPSRPAIQGVLGTGSAAKGRKRFRSHGRLENRRAAQLVEQTHQWLTEPAIPRGFTPCFNASRPM